MNKARLLVVGFSIFSLAIMAPTAILAQQAEGSKTEGSKAEVNKNAPKVIVPRVSEAGFARELAVNGREVQDPYLLIQAAELLSSASKLPGPKAEVKTEKAGNEKKISLEPADLLREAAKMAAAKGDRRAVEMAAEVARNATIGLGNESLADEISKTEVARGFNVRHGPLEGADCLYSGQTVMYEYTFKRNEDAAVSVSTGDYLPVDIYVYDSHGLVTSDESTSTTKVVTWYMLNEGKIRVLLAAHYGATCYGIYIP